MKAVPLLACPFALLLAQCQTKDPTPVDQLPPATQTGANTFGCLLNGQPWTPQGYNGRANFIVTYDPGYRGGNLAVRVYRYPAGASTNQYLLFGSDRIDRPGTYPFELQGDRTVYYADFSQPSPCQEFKGSPLITYRHGSLTITRFDLTRGVIAGTFAFTLYQPGCDSVRVTQGRFDKQL